MILIFSTAKQKLVYQIPAFLEGPEMDGGSEERTSGCEIYDLTSPALPQTTKAESSPTTPPSKRPTRPFVYRGESIVMYKPRGGTGSGQSSGTPLTDTQRRYLNYLKNALANGKIRATVIHGRPVQSVKSINKSNQNNGNTQTTSSIKAPMRPVQVKPRAGIPLLKNSGFDVSTWLQILRKWSAGQTGNQGQLPQGGSNQNNFPQGGSPHGGSNQYNFPQGGSPQRASNQNNPQGGAPLLLSTHDEDNSGTVSQVKKFIAWPVKDLKSKVGKSSSLHG